MKQHIALSLVGERESAGHTGHRYADLRPVNFASVQAVQAPLKPHSKPARSPSFLPDYLISRSALDDLRARLAELGVTKEKEPDWNKLRESLAKKHGLSAAQVDELVRALERLWLLPFHRYETCAPHMLFLFTALPKIESGFRRDKDKQGLLLTKAYRVMAEMLLQGCSICPGEPHYLADHLKHAIESPVPEARADALPIARLLASTAGGSCGNNRYQTKNPNIIAVYEHRAFRGMSENALATAYKFESYERKLRSTKAFWRDWDELNVTFKDYGFWDKYGIVRRTPIPEGNWQRERLPHFRNIADRFQAAFDVFCWKWFLYGMKRAEPCDEPLVQKMSYAFTPYGTQIFIPGFWSLDVNRDFNWAEITRLHRARGIPRAGKKLDRNREELLEQAERARNANREAKKKSLRGEKRFAFIKANAGLDERTDDAQVRRLLAL